MNHSPAYILAQYLIGEGLLSDPTGAGAWKVYVGMLPDGQTTEHNAVGCIDTTPLKDGRLNSGPSIFHYGIQLLLRSSAYNTGYAKASALLEALEAVDRDTVTISGTTYRLMNVSPTGGIVVLGQEDGTKRRELFSVNFLVTLKEV